MTVSTVLYAVGPVLPAATSDSDLIDQGEKKISMFWEWFTGWPLQVLIVLVAGVVLLAVVRRTIARVTDRIAQGYHRAYVEAEGTLSVDGARTRGRKAVAQDPLGLVTPELKARRSRRARTVGSVLTSTATIVIVTTMALFVLGAVGAGDVVGYLVGTAGIAAVAVGFGAQSLVRDFLSGLFILVEDQFGVGDEVNLGFGVEGTVERVDLRLTHVRSFDGTLWHVRNGEILRAGNHTQQWARAVAAIRVPVGSDIAVVRQALERAAEEVRADPACTGHLLEEPAVRGVDSIDEGAYSFTMHAKVQPGTDGDVKRTMLMAAYAQLRDSGIIVTAAVPED